MSAKDSPSVLLRVKNLYKLFGPDPASVVPMLKDGVDKAEIQQATGHVLALNNINIDIRAGLITVIMGLSGSGKSTLIRHVNRLIEPTAGEIFLDGEDILGYNLAELRAMRQRRMSMVFQKFALLPHCTVLENAQMPLKVRDEDPESSREQAMRWIDRVGLAGFESSHPHQLSGGMQQRVGLARALTADTDIMLMDEAFSALDPLIRVSMQDLLLELQSTLHKTVIFITHDLDEALKLADHLVILKDGFIVQQDEPQEILLRPKDPYVESFVQDINRARVIQVRSVMKTRRQSMKYDGVVAPTESLESLINKSDGNYDVCFEVRTDKKRVGYIRMHDVLKALVRYEHHASEA